MTIAHGELLIKGARTMKLSRVQNSNGKESIEYGDDNLPAAQKILSYMLIFYHHSLPPPKKKEKKKK